MAGFRESLKKAVRQIAFRTDLDSLKKQGVNKVNVLGLDRIVALIDEAVHRSLKSRLVGIEREAVADATKSEFLRLLRSNQDLERQRSELERMKDRAEEEVDGLRRELQLMQRQLDQRMAESVTVEDQGRYEGENQEIAEQIHEVLKQVTSQGRLDMGGLQERLMELVLSNVKDQRRSAEEARTALRDREVENLQRRIAKLTESLDQTEQRLRKVSSMKTIDDGISSIYREVQGLNPQDSDFGKKKELMSAIFQANKRLQKKAAQ
jgi:exonuclease VII large subunit